MDPPPAARDAGALAFAGVRAVRRLFRPRDPERVPAPATLACRHLDAAVDHDGPGPAPQCADCIREGTAPIHLRMCLTCGNVACCDSGGAHATAHYRGTGHPVMRSIEPGETWRWCYPDERLG